MARALLPPGADALLDAAPDALLVTDDGGWIHRVNFQATVLLAVDSNGIVGTGVMDWISAPFRAALSREHRAQLHRVRQGYSRTSIVRSWGRRSDEQVFPVELALSGVMVGDDAWIILRMRDLTSQEQQEQALRYMGTHDALTGLFNRGFFDQAVEQACRGSEWPVGIIMMDLDGLKVINDFCGHPAGDDLLRNTASVLQGCFRPGDVVARLGGDEFAVLLLGQRAVQLESAAQRIESRVAAYNATHRPPPLHLSVGCAAATSPDAVHEAVRIADMRMLACKRQHHARQGTTPRG